MRLFSRSARLEDKNLSWMSWMRYFRGYARTAGRGDTNSGSYGHWSSALYTIVSRLKIASCRRDLN